MKAASPYLLTSVQGIPIIIKCKKQSDKQKFAVKGSVTLGRGVAKKALQSGEWVDDNIDEFIADIITSVVGTEHECWIRKVDAHDKQLE